MNNLKRILSLALASVMVIGMMVVGASAAEFTDADKIKNADAVDTMVALSVIKGRTDGSFDPTGDVTRAEYATMIARALHGGAEDYRGTSSGSQFKDVADGQWYTKHINFCVGENIIKGKTTTIFDPDGKVTAQEAVLMMMRAMGYRDEIFTVNGSFSWTAVNKKAEQIGLYNETDVEDFSASLNRQNTAQVICTGIQLPTPTYTESFSSNGNSWTMNESAGKTILEDTYKAKIEFGILTKTEYAAATGYTYTIDGTTGKGFTADVAFKHTVAVDGKAVYATEAGTISSETDVASDLFMQQVKVVYSGNILLSITPAFNNVLKTGVWAGAAKAAIGTPNTDGYKPATIGGCKYEDDTVATPVNFNGTTATPNAWDTYVAIDNDGDNLVNAVIIYPNVVEQVTEVKDGKVTTVKANVASPVEGDYTTYTIEATDAKNINATTKDTLAKGDFVLVSAIPNGMMTVLTKATVTENVTATYKTTDDEYTIGGQKYELATGVVVALGTAYDIVVVNGYVLTAPAHSDGTVAVSTGLDLTKVAYVTGYAAAPTETKDTWTGNSTYTQQVELLFTDGTKDIVTVANWGVKGGTGDDKNDPAPITATSYLKDTAATESNPATNDKGLVSFTEKDGKYSLVTMADPDPAEYAKVTATSEIKDGKQGSVRFNNSAVMYVIYNSGKKVEVLSGAEVNAWPSTTGALAAGGVQMYAKKNTTTGFEYVDFGVITLTTATLPGAPVSELMYGYVINSGDAWDATANSGKGASAVQVVIWNGTENAPYFVSKDGATAEGLPAGSLVSYKLKDGKVNDINVLDKAAIAKSVKAYENGIAIFAGNDSTEYDTSKSANLLIDEKNTAGATAGTIKLAANDKTNVYAVIEGGVLKALFVEINNETKIQPDSGSGSGSGSENPPVNPPEEEEEENPCENGHTVPSDISASNTGSHTYTCEECDESVTEDCTGTPGGTCSVCQGTIPNSPPVEDEDEND